MSIKFSTCIEARRYVYNVLGQMIDDELRQGDEGPSGWMFGGVEDEPSQRRLVKELHKARTAMYKRRDRIGR